MGRLSSVNPRAHYSVTRCPGIDTTTMSLSKRFWYTLALPLPVFAVGWLMVKDSYYDGMASRNERLRAASGVHRIDDSEESGQRQEEAARIAREIEADRQNARRQLASMQQK